MCGKDNGACAICDTVMWVCILIIDFETSCNSVLTELMSYVSKSQKLNENLNLSFDGFLAFA